MTVGYSGKALIQKLGIREGSSLLVVNPPPDYDATLGPLPAGVRRAESASGPLDLVQVFVRSRADLERRLPGLKRALAPAGALWVSWPKKTSGVLTDLTENVVRDVGLAQGLVDVKVCAVDEVWSGLKFVIRLQDR